MKPLIAILCLALAGCAHKPVVTPQTVSVRASGMAAKRKVTDAGDMAKALKDKVAPELKPDVEAIEQDLREANAQLDAQTEAVKTLDVEIAIQSAQVTTLTQARDAALNDRNRWRKRGQLLMTGIAAIAGVVAFQMIPSLLGWYRFAAAAAVSAAVYTAIYFLL